MSFDFTCSNGHKNRSQEAADNCRWCNTKVTDKSSDSVQLNASKEKVDRKQLEDEFRNKRKKFGDFKQSGSIPEIPGYYVRWVSDSPKRKPHTLSQLIERGYQFVNRNQTPIGVGIDLNTTSDIGELVSRVRGTNEDGSPSRHYLVAIRKDWRDEDRKEFHKKSDKQEDVIRRGGYGLQNADGITIDPVLIKHQRA
jgi:hypothetical protein